MSEEKREEPRTIFETIRNVWLKRKEALEKFKKPSIFQQFLELSVKKKIAVLLLIIAIVGFGYAGAVIISNIIEGTTVITGLQISVVNPPLLPAEALLETEYTNIIRVHNPMTAARNVRLIINFTATNPTLEIAYFDVYFDINRNNIFEVGEKLTCTKISDTLVNCRTPTTFSVPAATTTNFLFKATFKSGLPVPNTIGWKVYLEE